MKTIAAIVLFVSTIAQAHGISNHEMQELITNEVIRCPSLNCDSRVRISESKVFLSREERLAAQDLLSHLAFDYWPDTVLEGPYVTDSEAQVSNANINWVLIDGQKVAYRMAFSAQAWNLDRCQPARSHFDLFDEDLRNCQRGKIVDRAFVSKDFSLYFHDDGVEPAFVENQGRPE